MAQVSQCERCSWGLLVDGRLFCRHPGLPVTDAGQDERACVWYRAGAPVVEWKAKPKGTGWKRLGDA